MERMFEESRTRNEKLEAEVENVRAHSFKLSEKCSKSENRIFSLGNFISDKDMPFTQAFHRMLFL